MKRYGLKLWDGGINEWVLDTIFNTKEEAERAARFHQEPFETEVARVVTVVR